MMIRPATADDAQAVAGIWNPIIRNTLVTFNSVEKTPDELSVMFREKAAQGYAFFVAQDDDAEVLGFATYGQFRGGAGYRDTMEHTIILHEKARGRGVGRILMLAIEDHARARGAHSIFAGVSAQNPDAIAFHAALGYVKAARLPEVGNKFGQWLDLVLMQKFL